MKYTRIIAASMAAVCCMGLLAGCSEKEPDFTKEEELPYGATMRSNKNSFAVPMTYDRRFLDEEQVAVVADLLGAVQNQDTALFEQTAPDFYVSYQRDEVYKLNSTEELLAMLHDRLAEAAGDDFQFSMVLITDISQDRDSGELADALVLFNSIYDGDSKFSDTLEEAWNLTVEWDFVYDNGKQYSVAEGEHMYLFRTADGYTVSF